jgi:hypothetical protein
MQVNKEYLRWCSESPMGRELQWFWRREPYTVRDGAARPTRSNICPGDRFMHGARHWEATHPQISLVTDVLTIVEVGKIARLQYGIAHNIGGHPFRMEHGELASGYFVWIPHLEQLVAAGLFIDVAWGLVQGV